MTRARRASWVQPDTPTTSGFGSMDLDCVKFVGECLVLIIPPGGLAAVAKLEKGSAEQAQPMQRDMECMGDRQP